MSDKVPAISFEQALLEISKSVMGAELILTIVSDYKPQGKVVVPVVSTFKMEILQARKEDVIDFLAKINEMTPILRVQFSKILSVTPPPQVQEFINLLKKPCQNCGDEESKPCDDCKKEDK